MIRYHRPFAVRYPAVNHTRMRLRLSALNSQRYMYSMGVRGAKHLTKTHTIYCFVCSAYALPCQSLTQNMNLILLADILENIKPKASCSWGKGKYYKLFTYKGVSFRMAYSLITACPNMRIKSVILIKL